MMHAMASVRFADALHAVSARSASDIHLVPGLQPAIRVDGRLEYLNGSRLSRDEVDAIGLDMLGADGVARVERGEDVTRAWFGEESRALRVHGYRSSDGLALAMRVLTHEVPTLDSLHLPPVVASLAQRSRGLVIFAGPTGSGKSTSLAALIERINATSARRVITIEDPIEYHHVSRRSTIVQREIGRDAESYAGAIVGSLRADPDVLLIGEMREKETMAAVLTAAETGHLVFSTLHTGDAAGTIDRIVDAFAGSEQAQVRAQLSQVLAAVVCQRLVPRAGGLGRRALVEVLVATDAVRSIVRDGRTHQLRNAVLTGREAGMQTFEHHLSELVARGEVDSEVALA
jgi:twitching motility protein PilT